MLRQLGGLWSGYSQELDVLLVSVGALIRLRQELRRLLKLGFRKLHLHLPGAF